MINSENILRDEFAQLEDDWENAAGYLSLFIDESRETLDELTEALLALEAGGGRENIEQLFIGAHRIKGSAASIGLNRPAKLAHLMEDLLQVLVTDGSVPPPQVADGLLACTDGLRQYVNAMSTGQPGEDQFATLAQQLLEARAACDEALQGDSVKPQEETPTAESRTEPVAAPMPSAESEPAMPQQPANASGVGADLHRRVVEMCRDHEHEHVLVGRVFFEPNLPLVGLKARLVCSKLSNLGELRYIDPPLADIELLDEIASLQFGVSTEKSIEDVVRTLQVAGVQNILAEPLVVGKAPETAPTAAPAEMVAAAETAPARPAMPATAVAAAPDATMTAPTKAGAPAARTTEAGVKPAETLRVDVERLDNLMNLAGQLAIGKARVAQIGDKLKTIVIHDKSPQILDHLALELRRIESVTAGAVREEIDVEELAGTARRLHEQLETVQREVASFSQARACVNHLFESIHLLDSVSDGIRQSVMDMRMLPIGPLFTRFHRVIRDITRSNAKDIRLTISGEKTELDKRMIDELGDPMIHLVRNAADHGIESPEEREAAGKPRQGTVSLDAFHRGSSIVIRVSDDGRGLNAERIRQKAIEKGLVSAADAEGMTPDQIYQFIWHPGLSTAAKVTDVSGRGVGMDIVRARIKDLNGTVDVASEFGQGTTFTIRLPLTLAVLPSLMVEVDNDVFCIPLESVVEIVGVKRRDMSTVHGHWTVPIRNRIVAVLTLGSLFKWRNRGDFSDGNESDERMLVIIGEGSRHMGLAVDQVLGEEDVVIKSIADNYRNVAGVAGASILGDGRISLILDPPTLIEMASRPVVGAGKT
jgi:two-component system chemotaxis sensor kinase CheA